MRSRRRLIEAAAKQTETPERLTRAVVDAFLAAVKAATWKLGHVVVPGFASFNVRRRVERGVRIVVNGVGHSSRIPAADVVKVRAAKAWRSR